MKNGGWRRIAAIGLTVLVCGMMNGCGRGGNAGTDGRAGVSTDDGGRQDGTAEEVTGTGEDDVLGNDAGQEESGRTSPVDAADVPALDGKLGDFGRIIIPWSGYSAAVYYSLDDDESQEIVDAEDSAVATRRREDNSTLVIADHTDQGFSAIYDAVPDESRIYLYKSEEEVETYVCTKHFNGHNNLVYLTDEDGNDLSYAPTDLILYTCNEVWENVTITYWERVE